MIRIAVLSAVSLCLMVSAAEAKRPPNIVFFLVDDMGWTDPACYGNKFHETPNINRLATQGMKFTNAYAACPVCSPTRASIMSGKYPATLAITDFIPGHLRPWAKLVVPKINNQLPLKEVSLAEAVKPAGYVSGSFGKWHLGGRPFFPDKQGFDDFVVTSGRHFAPRFRTTPKVPVKKGEYLGDFLTRQAERFIEKNRDKPFLLYLPHYAVHIPLEAKKKLVEKYATKRKKTEFRPRVEITVEYPGASKQEMKFHVVRRLKHAMRSDQIRLGRVVIKDHRVSLTVSFKSILSNDEIEQFVSKRLSQIADFPESAGKPSFRLSPVNHPTYAAMVEHIDQSLGRIMKKLDELKLADNTVLIFFSDNGGLYRRFDERGPAVMSNHPLRDEKGSLYEGGIREPCIIRWPGVVTPGATCDVPVTSVDFWPTIAEIAGTSSKFKHRLDGVSLLPLLKQSGSLKDRALYWHYPHYHHTTPGGAIRYGDYKLIEYFEDGKLELYNLKKDIGEQTDLARKQPAKVKQLHAMLKTWRKKVGARMPTKNPYHNPKRAHEWRSRRKFKRKAVKR